MKLADSLNMKSFSTKKSPYSSAAEYAKIKVLIMGKYPDSIQKRILESFPADWQISIAEDISAAPYPETADVIIPEHTCVGASLLDRMPALRFVQTGSGHDNVDIAECSKRGITVCSASGVNAGAVAEHALALILAWYKNIPQLNSFMKENLSRDELEYSGSELRGLTAGIVGLGAAGQKTAALCRAFGMNVIGYNDNPKDIDGIRSTGFEALLEESDIVSLHIPSTPATFHMMGRQQFHSMKSTALLVNTSRGAVVNEEALCDALSEKIIAGACLDVFETEPLPSDSRLRDFPNVILTPHTAGLPDGAHYQKARYDFFARNISRFFSGETPENKINPG